MGDIVSFENGDPWLQGAARCRICGYEFQAVIPEGGSVHELECPECHSRKAFFMEYAPPSGGIEWLECSCGCDLYFVTRTHVQCAACGRVPNLDEVE